MTAHLQTLQTINRDFSFMRPAIDGSRYTHYGGPFRTRYKLFSLGFRT